MICLHLSDGTRINHETQMAYADRASRAADHVINGTRITCLTGMIFVRRTGMSWQMLSQDSDAGLEMACRRRLRDWQQAGVWDLIHSALLDWLARNQLDEYRTDGVCAG